MRRTSVHVFMPNFSAGGRQTGLMFVLVKIDTESLVSFFKVGLLSCGIEVIKRKLLSAHFAS